MARYQYKRLTLKNEIRCLLLEPGVDNDPLKCSLLHSPLSNGPEYEAISYVWGSNLKNHTIVCEDRQVNITKNLYNCLQQVRSPTQSRIVWADSICINQDNNEEKNHQVRLMGEIYRRAKRVLITLGSDSTSETQAKHAAAFVAEVNDMIQKKMVGLDGYNSFPYPEPGDPLLVDPRWKAVGLMTEHPWFERGWVIQEAVLARDAQLKWGRETMAWTDLSYVMRWLLSRAWQLTKTYNISFSDLHHDQWERRFESQSKVFKNQGDSPPFTTLDVLDSGRELRFTDDRDRVYGLLALIDTEYSLDGLHITYEKPSIEVYRDFAVWYITQTKDLTLLHFVANDKEDLDADSPSWVPQWQRHFYYAALLYAHEEIINSAASPGKIQPSIKDDTCLETRGMLFDTVRAVGASFGRSSDDISIDDTRDAWTFVSEQSKIHGTAYNLFPILDAFYYAIKLGLDAREVSPERTATINKAYLAAITGPESSALAPDGVEKNGESTVEFVDLRGVHNVVQAALQNRHIAVTHRGYLAIVPTCTQPGDICSVIFGTRAPFILRKRSEDSAGCYKLMGSAFMVSTRGLRKGSTPYRLGTGFDGNEDWLNWDLREQDIMIC